MRRKSPVARHSTTWGPGTIDLCLGEKKGLVPWLSVEASGPWAARTVRHNVGTTTPQ